MKKLLLIAVIALAGCASEAEKAEDAFVAAKNSGASETELCRSAQAVKGAYERESENAEVKHWAGLAQAHCSLAFFEEGYRY